MYPTRKKQACTADDPPGTVQSLPAIFLDAIVQESQRVAIEEQSKPSPNYKSRAALGCQAIPKRGDT